MPDLVSTSRVQLSGTAESSRCPLVVVLRLDKFKQASARSQHYGSIFQDGHP